jgi:polyisoprenyl-teichoic acid--peptidoglycan teichoic acid transferase
MSAPTSTAPSFEPSLATVRTATKPEVAAVRFRRALMLLLMTLVAPGSAQLSAGMRRIGRFALGMAIAILLVTVLLLGLWFAWPRSVLRLISAGPVLPLLRWLLFVLAIGWVGLFVDAWRLGRPLTLRRDQRLKLFGLTAVLSVFAATALIVSAGYVNSGHHLIANVFGDGSGEGQKRGRYNILLLGGDAGRTRSGLRPDSITIASVDAGTGDSVLFGLPRNLQKVPFPEGTVMHEHWPNGFDCGDECLLNAVYTWAEAHKDLFANVQRPGVEATRAAVEGITGLEIGYTVMIDLRGFRQLIDATGGVTVDVAKRVPLGSADDGPIYGWIEAGPQRLDGAKALWFARSRRDSSDYERMARQKCVLSAMLKQLNPGTVLGSFQGLASASARTVWTDIPAAELNDLVKLAMRAKRKTPHTVNFVPPRVKTSEPDFQHIRTMVREAIHSSEKPIDIANEPAPAATIVNEPSVSSSKISGVKSGSTREDDPADVSRMAERDRPICSAP